MLEYEKVVANIRTLEAPDARRAVIESLSSMSMDSKKAVVESVGGTMPIGQPGDKARDRLWLLVVGAFVIVLVGSFGTLAYAVFNPPDSDKVKPELILSLFTSVVGFLAGLFVPAPGRNGGATT